MPLDRETRKDIQDFVRTKPRTIQEIAERIGKSWRTADRYTAKMEDQEGLIQRRTFREGTRGALKIVYWNNIDTFNSSKIQEQLLTKIEAGRDKRDFSPFDIYQCADEDKRNAFAEQQPDESVEGTHKLFEKLRSAQERIFVFSGNLTWANVTHNGEEAIDVFRELADDGITIKFLGSVDIASISNAKKLLALNESLSEDMVSVRHAEQPLRAFIVDDKHCQFKELRHPEDGSDVDTETHLFYNIHDQEWVEWTQQVFWKLYRGGIPAERRIQDLESIQNIQQL
ncbi:MAG: hypothetical protein SVU32_03200 [Candidatus Nanohaloarchaea archaeon]|nr:hypothetical protein [Candidatus Nanohaloarchaea archaeon]